MLPRSLSTSRLSLEAINASHAPHLWRAQEVSMAELLPYMAWAPTASAENTAGFAAVMEQKWEEGHDWTYTIFFEDDAAGVVALNAYQPLFKLAEIGYWTRSDLAGRGLMTEAAGALVDAAFDAGMHRIELRAALDNTGSIRVAEKLGFEREGILREASWAQRGFLDLYMYARLARS